jgi:predicted metal-dependent TIM-barrel fold hydrolase
MRIFDPHIHCLSRVTDDYERMHEADVRVVLEPAFWLGQPRTSVGTFVDYFDTLLGWERHRAGGFGIHHLCTMALNPREANDDRVNDDVLRILPRYLEKNGVVGVGEIGFDDQTAKEEKYFQAQIELAIEHELPILVHTPHRDKMKGFERSIAVVRESGIPMEKVLLDHGNEETIKITKDLGCTSGFSLYPHTKMSPERMVLILQEYGIENMIINSAADWGVSDPLMVPRCVKRMREAGFSEDQIEHLVWRNPIDFFGQTGRLNPDELENPPDVHKRDLYQGNSMLRGQDPDVLSAPPSRARR